MPDVSITTLPPLTAATIEHIGPYMEIGKAFGQLFDWLNARQLAASDVRVFGAFYDDPRQVAPEKLRSCAAAVVNGAFEMEPPVKRSELGGGEYAVLRYKGPYSGLMPNYDYLYNEWLPKSGRQLRSAPSYEEYVNDPRDTPPEELLTDIFIPLV
jgi:AraC family transcriptional regulator